VQVNWIVQVVSQEHFLGVAQNVIEGAQSMTKQKWERCQYV